MAACVEAGHLAPCCSVIQGTGHTRLTSGHPDARFAVRSRQHIAHANANANAQSQIALRILHNGFFQREADSRLAFGTVRRSPWRSRGRACKGATAALLDRNPAMQEAAMQVVDLFVKNGMVVGLGTGLASRFAIEYIGEKLSRGTLKEVQGVPMSSMSAADAAQVGLPLTTLEENPKLDFAFTSADLVQEGTLYSVLGRRGAGGCESVLTEKAVAQAAEQLVVMVEEKAFVERLEGAVPVIISQENWLDTAEEIDDCFLGDAEVWRRPSMGPAGPLGGDFPLVTSEGHFVLDVLFTSPIEDPVAMVELLQGIEGVVDHGLLLDHVYAAAVGSKEGVKIRTSLFKQAFISNQ